MSDRPNAFTSPATWLRRLLVVQESGLALVILLFCVALALLSGTAATLDFRKVPAGATVTETDAAITVVHDGETKVYSKQGVGTMPGAGDGSSLVARSIRPIIAPARTGWELRGAGDDQSLRRTRLRNTFLNLENLMEVLVNSSFIAVLAVGVTCVITLGGIDLSIGSTYALAAIFGAIALRYPFSEGFPQATLGGGQALWWGVLALGALMLVGGNALKGMRFTHDADAGVAVRTSPGVLIWVGLGLLIAAGWQFMDAMQAVGSRVQSGELPRSPLPGISGVMLALIVCGLVGGVCGWINGALIVGLRVHPFIITLGTMAAYRGLTALPTNAQSVGYLADPSPNGPSPAGFQDIIKFTFLGVTPVPVLVMILVCLLGVFFLTQTVLGRRVFAIGGNETAAAYAGIPVGRVKTITYTIMGALAGVAAFLYLGYFGGAEPAAGTGYELKAIAAAVIGGASLSGGRGSALGAVLGAILVQLIDNGMVMLRIDQSYNNIVLGGAIIAAVVLDQLKSRLVPTGR
ncbi:MAG TPA: ABC transporter permease [Phycisphaerales bacterium]|nr:ABC transporter permease [Phycisphaerales bacterium]